MADEENAYSFTTTATRHISLGNLPEGGFEMWRGGCLPEVTLAPGRTAAKSAYSKSEILHIRHHSLFAPRDFDLSPYFQVIKPSIQKGFDYKSMSFSGKISERDILRE